MKGKPIEVDKPTILEVDGPPMAFFEIPLDYFATPNGEIEPEGHPEAERLIQRITYMNFRFLGTNIAQLNNGASNVIDSVRARLQELGGGLIWWRSRPKMDAEGGVHRVHFRLGTTPTLPPPWWIALSGAVGNANDDRRMLGNML